MVPPISKSLTGFSPELSQSATTPPGFETNLLSAAAAKRKAPRRFSCTRPSSVHPQRFVSSRTSLQDDSTAHRTLAVRCKSGVSKPGEIAFTSSRFWMNTTTVSLASFAPQPSKIDGAIPYTISFPIAAGAGNRATALRAPNFPGTSRYPEASQPIDGHRPTFGNMSGKCLRNLLACQDPIKWRHLTKCERTPGGACN